jgi:hypothetical protein
VTRNEAAVPADAATRAHALTAAYVQYLREGCRPHLHPDERLAVTGFAMWLLCTGRLP